ncbi:hypothetical protein PUMCH_004044 [Australozyma saopauloensis]|uniref:Association with the SNF1 complex (ASC) domain-containing protein n=1 Tax=Australozyma saopauloensis TaxID=291208 RepID=A0AAX4HDI8_9ASCO|nr:hypothetical protein PUMCH_004044 [[Candida] saopauloensis]
MGNNTSTTRKSLATVRHVTPSRKSHLSAANHHNLEEEFSDLILHEVKRQKHDSGLTDAWNSLAAGAGSEDRDRTAEAVVSLAEKGHFSNDLLEDEFNELGHGVLENGAGDEVLRNILPSAPVETVNLAGLGDSGNTVQNPSFEHIEEPGSSNFGKYTMPADDATGSAMAVDSPGAAGSAQGNTYGNISSNYGAASSSDSGFDNNMLTGVDFTRAALPAMARQRPQPPSRLARGHSTESANSNSRTSVAQLIPVKIKWVNQTRENIVKVSIIGSFSNWRDVIKLKRSLHNPNEYLTTVKLPLGVHKLLYVVNNEYRVLELLPTATDQEGIFFNWFEVLDPHHLFNNNPNIYHHSNLSLGGTDGGIVQVAGEHDASQIQKKSMSFLAKVSKQEKESISEHVEYAAHGSTETEHVDHGDNNYSTYHEHSSTSLIEDYPAEPKLEYSSEIPEMLMDYNYFKNKGTDYELPEPPQLPAHLNNVLLNKMSSNLNHHQANNIPQVTSGNRPALRRADSSYYASNGESYHRVIPNHVILNHLMTTSIRNDVLTVACITRYSGKFVTQVMHSPADVLPDA